MRDIAETFTDDEGMLFVINEEFRERAICCDVSWISKFGIGECEILIARSVDAVFNRFKCKIIDERNGTQIVSLKLYDAMLDTSIADLPINSVSETEMKANVSDFDRLFVMKQNDKLYGSYLAVTKFKEIM